jgi:hypothetical protein
MVERGKQQQNPTRSNPRRKKNHSKKNYSSHYLRKRSHFGTVHRKTPAPGKEAKRKIAGISALIFLNLQF